MVSEKQVTPHDQFWILFSVLIMCTSLQGHGVHEGRPHYDFISLSKELSPPGSIFQAKTELPFLFKNMDKEHESYRGRNVAVR
jgi:hypothetical protein